MIPTNGESSGIYVGSAFRNHFTAAVPPGENESARTGMDEPPSSRRYSNGGDLTQGRNGESSMIANYQALADWGYSIIWAAGEYCQANREERDVTFRWNGERWIEL